MTIQLRWQGFHSLQWGSLGPSITGGAIYRWRFGVGPVVV